MVSKGLMQALLKFLFYLSQQVLFLKLKVVFQVWIKDRADVQKAHSRSLSKNKSTFIYGKCSKTVLVKFFKFILSKINDLGYIYV